MNTKGSQVNEGLSDGQTRSLRAMSTEKEVEMVIFATASNMAWMEERGTDWKEFLDVFKTDWQRMTE